MLARTAAQAMSHWLGQWPWDWWATLTFRYPVSGRRAHRLWVNFLHALEHQVQGKIHYVRVTQPQTQRGDVPHFHALLMGVKGEDPVVWKGRWEQMAGLAEIDIYDPHRGATYYLAKCATSDLGDITFSQGLQKAARRLSSPSPAR